MYKSIKCWFTRRQICWQDFEKYTYRKQKIRPGCLICFPRICIPGLIYCDREPSWLLNVIEDDCYSFWVYIYGYQLDVRCFTLKSLSLSLTHECALKLTDLWITSLLFDLNYKFINRSFAFSPG